MSAKLRIPDSDVAPLTALAQLKPEELAAFAKALRSQEPSLDVPELTDAIAAQLSIERKRLDSIVFLLARLQGVREEMNLPAGEFVAALRLAIEQTGKPELCPQDWTLFESVAAEAISGTSALALSSKALQVMAEHHHVYCSARVLTDLRPIFKSDIAEGPATFVAVHTLRIIYHQGTEHKEFFVALDREDLERLSAVLGRALQKESSLRNLASAKDLVILER